MAKVMEKETRVVTKVAALRGDTRYAKAWERFGWISAKIGSHWRTRKNAAQLMKEERYR